MRPPFRQGVGREHTLFIHLTLIPYIAAAGELKTKPTQHSVRELMEIGIQPDILICRTERPLGDDIKRKTALFTNVDPANPAEIATTLTGITPRSASGETLTGSAIDSVNTFEAPNTVAPKPVPVKLEGNRLSLTLAPKSVTVIGVRP